MQLIVLNFIFLTIISNIIEISAQEKPPKVDLFNLNSEENGNGTVKEKGHDTVLEEPIPTERVFDNEAFREHLEPKLYKIVAALGTQNYTCSNNTAHSIGALVHDLRDVSLKDLKTLPDPRNVKGKSIGIHLVNPYPHWKIGKDIDIVAKVKGVKTQPDPTAVAWLELKVINPKRISTVYRVNTHGGVPQADACHKKNGSEIHVPYSALYLFGGK